MAISKAVISDEKLQIASTQLGKRVAVTRKQGQTAAAEFKREADITKQPTYDPKADKVYTADPKIGALLPRGSKVNLVIVAHGEGTFDYFQAEKVHPDLYLRNVAKVYEQVVELDLDDLVTKYAQGTELTLLERQQIERKLPQLSVEIATANPAKSFDLAMDSLVIAQKFGF
jgi:hypothetical protein